jgi:uncharacterized protein YndB with AHSA1/START domain
MKRNVKIEQILPHAPERVWHALTDQRTLAAWFMENDFVPELHREFTFRMKPQRGWDGLTHCEVIALDPPHHIAYTYRGEASGEKPLACAGINSRYADEAAKGIFAKLDTVLSFTLVSERSSDGIEQTRLVLNHTGFKGLKLIVVSFIMGMGWHKQLRRLSAVLDGMAQEEASIGAGTPQGAHR